MKNEAWGFIQNPFLNSTAQSYKKMNTLVADHLSRLNAEVNDADIVPMVARMQPAKASWEAAYGHWRATKGAHEGETQRFKSMLADLSANKIKEWDVRIQVVHPEGSSDYRALMTNRRTPFQTGSYESRISELYALREQLGAYPALSAVQVDVSAFYRNLLRTRDVQQQKEMLVEQAGDLLENERINIAQVMYLNLGMLMAKYHKDTVQVERYFDLELIRYTGQGSGDEEPEPGDNTVAAGGMANVLEGGFTSASLITIANTGNAQLTFYLAASAGDALAAGSAGIVLQPGETATYDALSFSPAFLPCLNVRNDSITNAGRWEVSIGN